MSVTLLRPYGGYATSAVVTFPDATETALIAQGLAVAAGTTTSPAIFGGPDQVVSKGGTISSMLQSGQGTPANRQGPSILPSIPLGSAALTGYETNGAVQTAGTWQYTEIFVPHWNTWAGAGWLNGTTVATGGEVAMVALWGSDGTLITNSAVAGVATAGASVFQNVAFLAPQTLPPGRYFLGLQGGGGATNTFRHVLAANGSNVICGSVAGVAGTVPATITVPSTFTTAVAPIMQLYT